jgi:hypothetical protein
MNMLYTVLVLLASSVAAAEPVAVPPPDALKSARSLLRDIYGARLDAAKTPVDHVKLARAFLTAGAERDLAPQSCYVLLDQARRSAMAAGDLAIAFEAINVLSASFQLDANALRDEAVKQTARKLRDDDAHEAWLKTVMPFIDESIDSDRYEGARQAALLAGMVSHKFKNKDTTLQTVKLRRKAERLGRQYALVTAAGKKLQTDKGNAQARGVIGRWHCFIKAEWDKGLPMLAGGDDAKQKAIAQVELSKPTEATAQVTLADGWWRLSQSMTDPAKGHTQAHAAQWYRKALPGLKGLVRKKAEIRMAFIDERAVSPKPAPGGQPVRTVNAKWEPIAKDGVMLGCYRLGPFPRKSAKDQDALQYLQRGAFAKPFFGQKPVSVIARKRPEGTLFRGPAKDQRDHIMYFAFPVKAGRDAEVNIHANTFLRWDHSKIKVYLDGQPVTRNGTVKIRRGTHLIVLRQHHMKSDRPGRSWVTLTLKGAGLQQARIEPAK